MSTFPIITLAVVSLAAAVHFSAEAASLLVYDRGQIRSGELWRLVTCNFVHFSKSHFTYDLLAFAAAGSLIELHEHRRFAWFCLLSPLVIGLAVFMTQPELEVFGGLSGVATGAIVFLCLDGLNEQGRRQRICLFALFAIAAKTTFEFATGQMVFAHSDSILIKPVPISHVAGAFTAAAIITARSLSGWWASHPHCLRLR